ncbi:glycosyltransferase family 4 protein [Clostridium sp. DL1XJH146]
MRICFLGDGNSVHIKRWLSFFRNKGYDVHLITFSTVVYENITVHKVGKHNINQNGGNWKSIFSTLEIKKILKEIKPDIINAHYVTSYGFIAALTGIKPLVISAWGSDILVTPKQNKFYKNITKFTLNRADLITSDSDIMSKEINQLSRSKTITVPMGVEKILCDFERKDNINEIKILSLRTLNKNSNIDTIVKSFSKIVKEYKDMTLKLIIINDGPEKNNIRNLIEELGICEDIEMKGFVSRKELLDLMISSQIYISIPTSDSTSVTLLEAMACGIPIIVSDLQANREWIENRINGLVLNRIDEEVLYENIKSIINNNKLKEDFFKINRDIILKRAIWDDNMETVEREYLSLLKK